ncbi:hypothetical protein GGR51DRAFT_557397 [Nemania sp. FL0031]|nr:hypothetical protein GGR51DRAFT_557397 [Nemania sp. FL0031]
MTTPQQSHPPVTGQFAWLAKVGATPEAVATLNDQPYVFFTLVAALVILILQGLFIWYIHLATMKPEQKKKKEKKDDKKKPARSIAWARSTSWSKLNRPDFNGLGIWG